MNLKALLGLITISGAFLSAAPALAQLSTSIEVDRGIEFSVDAGGSSVGYYSREKLKATTKTQGDFNLANKRVTIEGAVIAGVHSIEGIQHEHDTVEYKDGEDGTPHTRPGKPGTLRLRRDFASTSEFFKWRKAVLEGKVDRRSGSIIVHDREGEIDMEIAFRDCFPSELIVSGDPLNPEARAQELVKLDCQELAATVRDGKESSVTVKSRHDAAMAAIQNTR